MSAVCPGCCPRRAPGRARVVLRDEGVAVAEREEGLTLPGGSQACARSGRGAEEKPAVPARETAGRLMVLLLDRCPLGPRLTAGAEPLARLCMAWSSTGRRSVLRLDAGAIRQPYFFSTAASSSGVGL